MSYLGRLVDQSALVVADRAPTRPAPASADHDHVGADDVLDPGEGRAVGIVEIDEQVPAPPRPADRPAPAAASPHPPSTPPSPPSVSRSGPAASPGPAAEVAHPPAADPVVTARPAAWPPQPAHAPAPSSAEQAARDERTTSPDDGARPARDPEWRASIERHETLRRVVEWVSSNDAPAALGEPPAPTSRAAPTDGADRSTPADRERPARRIGDPEAVERSASPADVAPEPAEPLTSPPFEERVDIQIGAVNITVERPDSADVQPSRDAAVAPPVVTIPAPADAARPTRPAHPAPTIADRLRRRYVRV
jgi:hypothetical protein